MKSLFILCALLFLFPWPVLGYEIEWGTSEYKNQEIECSAPNDHIKEEIHKRIFDFAKIYKKDFLEKTLNKIYVCRDLSLSNLQWVNGTYLESENSIFVEVGNGKHNDTEYVLHHEFSSLIFLKYFTEALTEKWIQNNNFEYNYDYKTDGWLINPKLQRNGALYLYSTSDLENDFNVMASYYVTDYLKEYLDTAAKQFPRIQRKKEIIVNIYKQFLK